MLTIWDASQGWFGVFDESPVILSVFRFVFAFGVSLLAFDVLKEVNPLYKKIKNTQKVQDVDSP